MADYSKWLKRAEKFARSVMRCPGECGLKIDIGPLLDPIEAKCLDTALPLGLPQILRDFYLTASASVECTYNWEPDGDCVGLLEQVLPSAQSVYGGPHLCSALELPQSQQQLFSFAEVMDELGRFGPAAAAVMRGSVPLIEIANGDYMILHLKAQGHDSQVVYVSHEADADVESPITPISSTGEQFMVDWERIGYLGPEIWLLDAFLEASPKKLLESSSSIASRWRLVLKNLGLPIADYEAE